MQHLLHATPSTNEATDLRSRGSRCRQDSGIWSLSSRASTLEILHHISSPQTQQGLLSRNRTQRALHLMRSAQRVEKPNPCNCRAIGLEQGLKSGLGNLRLMCNYPMANPISQPTAFTLTRQSAARGLFGQLRGMLSLERSFVTQARLCGDHDSHS